ncbi:MAG: bifunctional demethylmenaquinone methyltransferase/2-methoxy-6-polyprenyl-1,4-benzoquinol methylase UbiE, partial [Bacteroidota bacterium]|nr:bifunctional demethylmenaquinone methyltransferase/2-methoxy-6-polyprenyl-1,4-benzoquinol methylase UbiE [Bacteroidota bacterium]
MNETPETLLPYGEGEKKTDQVETMFNAIAPAYDFMNRLMSFRQDIRWRRKALETLLSLAPASLLDVATGTGDFAIDAYRILHPQQIVGIDLSKGMMNVAEEKVKQAHIESSFRFEQQDCLSMTFPDNSFEAIISAFGVRNFEHIDKGLTEMFRVLKPGGKLVILELSRPTWFPAKQLFKLYTSVFFPAAGKLFSKDKQAYEYLPASIQLVPQGKAMTDMLTRIGFSEASFRTFTWGVCSM